MKEQDMITQLTAERDAWRTACKAWERAHDLGMEYMSTPDEGTDGGTGEDWEDIFVDRERIYDDERAHANRMTKHAEQIAQHTPLPPQGTPKG